MTNLNLNQFSKEVYEANKLKGFDVAKENMGQTLMLIVSELSEALEAHQKGNEARADLFERSCFSSNPAISKTFKESFELYIKDTFSDEIADTFIRLFDLCGAFEIDIDKHIELKMHYNALREYEHGKNY